MSTKKKNPGNRTERRGRGLPPGSPNAGRPKIPIDWADFDKLCNMCATLMEISGWFNCSEDTIENAVRETHGMSFSEYHKRQSAKGKASLRRAQLQAAIEDRQPTMLVWMGKQLLGQRDKFDHEHSGPGGGAIKTESAFDLSKLSKEELEQLLTMQKKLSTSDAPAPHEATVVPLSVVRPDDKAN